MDKCFVIQPFDKGKYDDRYEDVFKPSIETCGLIPYRIDKDPGSNILIEDIERNIRDSRICLAEITTDNPNVWYELGYAIACNKEVIMICSDERGTNYPFDVRHRNIIKYQTGSPRDYENLKNNIINRVNAILSKQRSLEKIPNTVLREKEGLTNHEITALVSIMSNQFSDNEIVWRNILETDMHNSGYNNLAISIAIKKLETRQFIEVGSEPDINGYLESYFRITEQGRDWIISNEANLSLELQKTEEDVLSDELPF